MAILSDGLSDSSVELLSSVRGGGGGGGKRTSMSLFQYTKRSMINSRVFITDNLMSEEILNPLMLNTMNLYVGLILTALSMNQYISDTKKVRDLISTVATESFDKVPDDLPKYTSELLDTYFGQLEATQPSIPSSNDTDDAINNQTECPYEGEDLPEDISSSEMSIVGKIISLPSKIRRLLDNNKTFYYVIMKINSLKDKTVKLKGISVYKFVDAKRKTVGKLTDLNTKKWEIKRWTVFCGGRFGGGGYKSVLIPDYNKYENNLKDFVIEDKVSYRSYPFIAVAPFVGMEYSITDRVHFVAKIDYLFSVSKHSQDFVTGPRLFLGFMFCHWK